MGVVAAAAIGASATLGAAAISADQQSGMSRDARKESPAMPMWDPGQESTFGVPASLLMSTLGGPSAGLMQQSGPFSDALNTFRAGGYMAGAGRTGQERMQNITQTAQSVMGRYLRALQEGVTVPSYMVDAPFSAGQFVTPEQLRALNGSDALKVIGYQYGPKKSKPGGFGWRAIHEVLGRSGFTSVDEMLKSQADYVDQQASYYEMQGMLRESAQELLIGTWDKRVDLLRNLPGATAADIEAVREAEAARMDDDFEEFDRGLLRSAQYGGFNPSAGLEKSATLRETGQNEALARAISLISGQQQLAAAQSGLLSSLDPSVNFLPMAPQFFQSAAPQQTGNPPQGQMGPSGSPWAAGIQGAGDAIAGGLLAYQDRQDTLALQDRLLGSGSLGAPAYNPSATPAQNFPLATNPSGFNLTIP
jgi:hypothetical protein